MQPSTTSSPELHAQPRARGLLLGALATLGLTAAHHIYGGLLYDTPWRLHGAAGALALAGVLSGFFRVYRRHPHTRLGRAAGYALVLIAFAFPVLMIGAFEGAYNHVLKNLLFFAGASSETLAALFPPSIYELPNDAGFEISGIAQVIPAAITARAVFRFSRAMKRPFDAPMGGQSRSSKRVHPGTIFRELELRSIQGQSFPIPDPNGTVHLQLRRFAGCPVCNLHLRSIMRRHDEILAAGIREVVVFHSPAEELQAHAARLPFAVIADPDKRLYSELGAECAPRALLDPRAWLTMLRAVAISSIRILAGREKAPALNPHGGRWSLPAELLIAANGRVVACKYGEHVDDHWSVDDLLERAGTPNAFFARRNSTS